ncbi:MAG: hypothetical protein GXP53_11570 [Deltaproteobacteria bacterium]|nr:hypothetical protein [Deltaproteobacteria bacterium]
MKENLSGLDTFIKDWPESSEQNKKIFLRLKAFLESKPGVSLEFHPRPELTYSLRAVHENQTDKALFTMIDVIEDQPRWLSICFYSEFIHDPKEKGNYVPKGLLGEDAVCFDLEEFNEQDIRYVETRLEEAFQSAAKG